MKKDKPFDCVRMKDEIQKQLLKEHGDLSWTKRNELIREAMKKNPRLTGLLDQKDIRRRPAS